MWISETKKLLLSDKTILSGAEKKLEAGTYCKSLSISVTLLMLLRHVTMGKSNHFSGRQ